MSMIRSYRRVLLVCCSVTAIAGVSGATVSAALAAQVSSQANEYSAVGPKVIKIPGTARSGVGSDVEQLSQLADLQRRQIAQQRQALGLSSGIEMFRVDFEPLPSDAARLNALITAQQRQIDELSQQVALQSPPATAPFETDGEPVAPQQAESTVEFVEIASADPAMSDGLFLPATLVEQDRAAREAFDTALAATRNQSSDQAYEADRTDHAVDGSFVTDMAPIGGATIAASASATPSAPAQPQLQAKLESQAPQMREARQSEQDVRFKERLVAESDVALFAAPDADPMLRMANHLPQSMPAQPVTHEATDTSAALETVHVPVQQPVEDDRVTQVAFAYYGTDTVPDKDLDEIRAGFVTSNGLVINIGIEFSTLINGELVVQNLVNLDDPLGVPGELATMITSADGGTTEIINTVAGEGGIATTITNTTNDVVIEQITTLSISMPNHADVFDDVGGGLRFSRGLQLPQTFIDMSVGAIAQ